MEFGLDREVDAAAPERLDRGTRPVAREIELVGQAGESVLPVLDLLGGQRFGIVLVAEHLALPDGEVGVLHRERLPRGGVALRSRDVGRHESRVSGPIDEPSAEMWWTTNAKT